jgi:hypothetical protein
MSCHHPKSRYWWPDNRIGWRLNKHGAVLCNSCDRIIGRVVLNEFGVQTALTREAKVARKRFRLSPQLPGH